MRQLRKTAVARDAISNVKSIQKTIREIFYLKLNIDSRDHYQEDGNGNLVEICPWCICFKASFLNLLCIHKKCYFPRYIYEKRKHCWNYITTQVQNKVRYTLVWKKMNSHYGKNIT